MEVPTDSVPVIMDLEDPVICDLASEFVHGLLEFWFGDLHNLDASETAAEMQRARG